MAHKDSSFLDVVTGVISPAIAQSLVSSSSRISSTGHLIHPALSEGALTTNDLEEPCSAYDAPSPLPVSTEWIFCNTHHVKS
ncbi:hypothetical protein AVEN_269220-1 [Araneus ventricosus]|uniref:Uncharacterized protein n=1 Tax=Araneus ventricosus TaxID=182803 RepID=A0A4Y2I2N2_ARAVE|nr:hypothetical protein AVEN_269220-1 [Araneus ventricosus]